VDFCVADVTFGAEVDAALDDSDVNTLADVGQVATDSLELARGHFDSAAEEGLARLVENKGDTCIPGPEFQAAQCRDP